MSEVVCRECLGVMQCPPDLVGKWVECPHCQHHFVLRRTLQQPNYVVAPHAQAPPGQRQTIPAAGYATLHQPHDERRWLPGIKTPILISAIFNVLWCLVLFATCYGAIFAIPLLVLCIFEFIYFGTADEQTANNAITNGRVLGIIEIVVGALSCNLAVLICGVLVLLNANQAEQEVAEIYGTTITR